MKKLLRTSIVLILFLPVLASAQGYDTLVDIPFIEGGGGFSAYFNALYTAAISLAALIAVIKIIIAGVKYMLSDVVTNKESAKKDIRTALLGLLIIVSAVLILETINPNLTNFKFKFEQPNAAPVTTGPGGLTSAAIQDIEGSECVEASQPANLVTEWNVTNCGSNVGYIVSQLSNSCREIDGTMKSIGSDSYQCTLQDTQRFSVDDGYSRTATGGTVELDSEYVSRDGNKVTYDAVRYCNERKSEYQLEDCLDGVENIFITNDILLGLDHANAYCDNNGGIGNRSGNNFTCELPTRNYTYLEAIDDYEGSGWPTEGEYERMCKEKLGPNATVVDTYITSVTGTADSLCVLR